MFMLAFGEIILILFSLGIIAAIIYIILKLTKRNK